MRQRVVLTIGLTVLGITLLGVVGVVYVVKAIGGVDRYEGLGVDAATGGPENYLVVGSDSRAAGGPGERPAVAGQRSDTIMVVRIDPSTESAAVLALPRDLVLPIGGTRGEPARINSAYNSGRQTLVDTIRENLGIEVNHYVEIDFQGFRQMVDAVGGFELWLDAAIQDTASGLFVEDQGCVTLDGEQALAYARSRQLQFMTPDGWSRPDPTADLGRIQRQQLFIRQALTTALAEARSNPLRFKELLDIGTGSVGIDGDTDPLELVQRFRNFDPARLATYSLPVVPRGDHATLAIDELEAEPVLALFRSAGESEDEEDDGDGGSGEEEDEDDEEEEDGPSPDSVDPSTVTVNVLNGTRVNGQAREVTEALDHAGFTTGAPSDGPTHDRTTVYYHEGERHLGRRVARHINGGVEINVDRRYDLVPGEVMVVTGADFLGATHDPQAAEAPAGGDPPATDPVDPAVTTPQATHSDYTVGQPPSGVDCG